MTRSSKTLVTGLALLAATGIAVQGSSHREAPGITGKPKLDGTDFYMFRSYEPGRQGYVTLIANYVPLQDAYGGPNFFTMDPKAVYEIHVDNTGDAREDLTFQFRFRNDYKNITVPAGGRDVAIPLINAGQIGPDIDDTDALNVIESYSVAVIRGDRRSGNRAQLTNIATGSPVFRKPVDRIGDKSLPDYAQYAGNHVYNVAIPGCAAGRLFVGQRREGFVVNLAEVFDLVNLNPLGAVDGRENVLADKNVTSLVLEVPTSCVTRGSDPVIGAWTTASELRDEDSKDDDEDDDDGGDFGRYTQVSRLGMPLVNELVIGIKDKNRFNASEPKDDAQFGTYVTNPTLPVLIQVLFGVPAPASPRNDLVQVFLTGVPGLNRPAGVRAAEMLRPRRRPGRLPQRPATRRRRGRHRAPRRGGRAAVRSPRGGREPDRRRTLDRDGQLHARWRDHGRRHLCAVPAGVPLSADSGVGITGSDAPVGVGRTVAHAGHSMGAHMRALDATPGIAKRFQRQTLSGEPA
jgi:hypothetical protein